MIKIDVDKRYWQIPKEECFLGVESDDKVKILQFELSKNEFHDGLNFTDCNCFINYKNEDNDTIPYGITDMELQEDGTVTFTWQVSRGATIFKGNTFAVLCAKKVRDDGTITNEWNSRIGSFTVAKGLEPSSSITEVPEIDIISQLLLVAQQTNENAQTNINQSSSLLEKAEGLGYLKEDFDVLEARMNQFTSLKEGSTTGDAELQDIRVGADGKTYDTAGDAVRGQIGELKGDLSNKITKFYASNQGETHITDSDNGKIQDMMIYGESSQDGTPSPENPVEVKSVVNPVVKFTSEDGSKVQTVTLNNITLNAIPVSKGGNVTINGQQYIADYVDVERGKVIRNILKWRLGEYKYGFNNVVWHINITSLGIDGSKIGLSNMFKIQDSRYNEVTTSELFIDYNGKQASLNMRGMADEEFKKWLREKNPEVYNVLKVAEEIPINKEEITALKELATYYPTTNIIVNSEQLDGYTVFNYPISMANGWNYVKQQLNDNRDYIYDMDLQSAEAYVNSEYAVALTELEV